MFSFSSAPVRQRAPHPISPSSAMGNLQRVQAQTQAGAQWAAPDQAMQPQAPGQMPGIGPAQPSGQGVDVTDVFHHIGQLFGGTQPGAAAAAPGAVAPQAGIGLSDAARYFASLFGA